MPRRSEGARLYLRERKGREPVFVIRDGEREFGTGRSAGERDRAEKEFETYLAKKHRPEFSETDPSKVLIADVRRSIISSERRPRGDQMS